MNQHPWRKTAKAFAAATSTAAGEPPPLGRERFGGAEGRAAADRDEQQRVGADVQRGALEVEREECELEGEGPRERKVRGAAREQRGVSGGGGEVRREGDEGREAEGEVHYLLFRLCVKERERGGEKGRKSGGGGETRRGERERERRRKCVCVR